MNIRQFQIWEGDRRPEIYSARRTTTCDILENLLSRNTNPRQILQSPGFAVNSTTKEKKLDLKAEKLSKCNLFTVQFFCNNFQTF